MIDTPVDRSPAGATPSGVEEIPAEWSLVAEREETYRWPSEVEEYDPYRVFSTRTAREGLVNIALGEAIRAQAWGRDRSYVIAFLSSGRPQTPLVEFLETDDYVESREMLAVIRGRDGGRRMYGPTDPLPDAYAEHFKTQIYRERVVYPGAWNKVAVIARDDDHTTMVNHALLQARRRGDI